MRKPTVAVFVACAVAACGVRGQLPREARGPQVLEVRGTVLEGGPYRLGREDLAGYARRKVRGTDPGSGRSGAWEGPEVAPLLTSRVDLKRGAVADVVVVHTADKRAIPVPLTLVRQLKPVLADRLDGQPIAERVIAWPTNEQRGLDTDPRARAWWATAPVALELVNGLQSYARSLSIPEGSPGGARAGAGIFEARCSACHRMRRVGGENGPDLTRVADRIDAPTFERVLTKHPGWTDGGPPPDGPMAGQLWAFLRAVAADPGLPAEEPQPARPPANAPPPRYP